VASAGESIERKFLIDQSFHSCSSEIKSSKIQKVKAFFLLKLQKTKAKRQLKIQKLKAFMSLPKKDCNIHIFHIKYQDEQNNSANTRRY
jgi:hypothetical protein